MSETSNEEKGERSQRMDIMDVNVRKRRKKKEWALSFSFTFERLSSAKAQDVEDFSK